MQNLTIRYLTVLRYYGYVFCFLVVRIDERICLSMF